MSQVFLVLLSNRVIPTAPIKGEPEFRFPFRCGITWRCRTGLTTQWCWMIDQPSGSHCLSGLPDLLEVTLQQALQSDAVASLVAGHLMDGVVDGIQTVLLGADSQIELALSCAELAVNAPCQVSLGVSPTGMQNRPFGPFQA